MPRQNKSAKKSKQTSKKTKTSAPKKATNTFAEKLLGKKDSQLTPGKTIGPAGAKRLKKGLQPNSGFLFKKRKPAKKKAPPKKK